jgi:hypothetical protein
MAPTRVPAPSGGENSGDATPDQRRAAQNPTAEQEREQRAREDRERQQQDDAQQGS